MYIVGFNDSKAKVIDAYPTLNLHLIIASGILKDEEEEEEGEEEEEATRGVR